MNVYTKNFEALKKCISAKREKLEELNNISQEKNAIKEREGCLHKNVNGVDYQIESKNPEQEVKLLLQGIDWKKENLIFVLGIGNRYLLKELSKHREDGVKIVIYEPDVMMLRYILQTEDMTDVLIPGMTLVWWSLKEDAERKEQAWSIITLNWHKFIYNMQIVTCPAYHMYMEEFKQVFVEVKNIIFQSYAMRGNAVDDTLQGVQQNVQNVIPCMEANSLGEIVNKYTDIPAIIVASGPSLEKNIKYLKEAQGKALIIACDASMEACKQYGVKPDAVATIERIVETYEYYYKGKTFDKDLVLLAPSLIWPDIYKEYKGKKIVLTKSDSGVDGWWANFFPNVKYQSVGASCATLAYAVATAAGCNPIILVGQDLAYTDNKIHSNITHTKYEGENKAAQSDEYLTEDIYGNPIYTSRVYNIFRLWFEMQIAANPKCITVDATEGGAKIHGSKIMTLKDAIAEYCTKDKGKNMVEYLSDVVVTPQQIYEKCKEISVSSGKIIRKLYKIKQKSEKHYKTLEKLYDQINDNTPEQKLVNIVIKMQKCDEIVKYVNSQEDILTYFGQYIDQTVNHVKGIGNALTPVNVLSNLFIQGNLMGALMRTSDFLIDEYQNIQKEMKKQMEITGITER